MSKKTKIIFSSSLMFFLLFIQPNMAQYINKGMWYHQQPTSQADSDIFFGGSTTYEGWCGPSALAMVFHYYIPNIHKILYDKYGAVDYHSTDGRGGLTSSDPYCYNASTTYPFSDFLAHHYLGYHVTTSGVGYSGLKSIIAGVDADLYSYTSDYRYVQLSDIRNYIDDGYLIVMNTTEHHYITIAGWEGSLTDLNQSFYYIWDGWKSPLGMESYTYKTEFVGNKNNLGSAKSIPVYLITATTLNAHFRDQIGDGTVLVMKFSPDNSPENISQLNSKGVMVSASAVRVIGVDNIINEILAHKITDIFVQVKDTNGTFNYEPLVEIISKSHLKGIKVHAWLDVLKDISAVLSDHYLVAGQNYVDVRDTNYRNYFLNDVIKSLSNLDIDGIFLNHLNYPANASDNNDIKEAISEYCKTTREELNNNQRSNVELSAAIIPEDEKGLSSYGQDVSEMSKYLNYIVLKTYTHSYQENPIWIGEQVKYFADKVNDGCKILTIIQSLDNDMNYTTPYEINQSVNFALANGSSGIIYSSYPLENWQWELSDKWIITNANERGMGLDAIPENFELEQNYPNPFNPVTNIQFKIPERNYVTLKVYDILGKEIAVLVDENKSAGIYNVSFNGNTLSSGLYLYKLTVNNKMLVKKMVVLK